MKKLIASLLIVAFFAPTLTFAAPEDYPNTVPFVSTDEGGSSFVGNQEQAAQAGIANLAASGEIVGCQSAGFGGALAQTFAAALQQAVPNFIRSQLQGPLSKLAAQAGPFGGLINSVANMAINKLSTYIQNQIGKVFTDIAGGKVGQALDAVTGGVGPGGAEVPVREGQLRTTNEKIRVEADRIKQAAQASATADCYANPLVRKLQRALLSLMTRSIIDFANGGFNGEDAIIQLITYTKSGVSALFQDFVQNATAGICSKDRGSTQALLLKQYEYEESYTVRSQCTDEGATDSDGDSEQLYNRVFQDQNTQIGAFMNAQSAYRSNRTNLELNTILAYLAGDGIKSKIDCTKGGDPNGPYCEGGLGAARTTLTGDQAGHIIKKAITTPIDQVLNADEIGELVDAFTAGLTQFIFQGIDGLAGASQKSSSGASYLDAMVDASAGGATTGTQRLIGRDIAAAAEVEQEYFDTVSAALTGVQQTKTAYTTAIACYQIKVNTSNSALALQRIQNASTTISTILNPQIATLTTLKQKSQAALNEYDALIERMEASETQDEVLQIHAEFTALISSGRVHTTADLESLKNDVLAASASLSILSTDARAQLTECQAL